jgi:hypothetical protein
MIDSKMVNSGIPGFLNTFVIRSLDQVIADTVTKQW